MLELINIDVELEGDNGWDKVLNDINLSLERNKIYVMTGPNGGGKSSIAKTIMGIHKPSRGKILIDGIDITDMSISERARRGIGYAFQTPARFKGLKVKDLLNLAAGEREIDHCEILYNVGLCAQDYLDREINSTFSGGELKRIEIASLLARQIKVALFDEPEAGIDLWSFQRLTETFINLHQKSDTTLVIISHQERILRLADVVIMVENGRISEITNKDKILEEISQLDTGCEHRDNCGKGVMEYADCIR
ncbi:MAG TPA: ATP-binding cassette domain-containing protein [Eubacteriaceae bacterium]|nr:ATP-binding cassette domain-containing protein [Eubacteriaceae bacterium]